MKTTSTPAHPDPAVSQTPADAATPAPAFTTSQHPLAPLTAADLALLPGEADVRFYRKHGYFVSPVIFTEAEIDAAHDAQERFYAGARDAGLDLPARSRGWTRGPGLRKNDYASLRMSSLAALVRKPILGAIAARLAGVDVIRLWHDQLLYKPSEAADAPPANVGWHTDKGYWKSATSENLLTAWIPFHACDNAAGTITMVDGSHRWPDNTTSLDFFNSDLDGLENRFETGGEPVRKVPMLLQKGQVSFHHCLTIHGSGPNRSGLPRRSMAVHLQDGGNRYDRTPLNGQPRRHGNDDLLRRDADGYPDYSDPTACPVLHDADAQIASNGLNA